MVLPLSLEGDFVEKVVIVGGGIAGLSCLNALLDRGVSPLLLEGYTIGTPKMCGEFLAPQAVALLQNWDIGPLQEIQQASFFSKNKKFEVVFPKPAGAISRSEVELLLAKRAQKKEGRIREKALIQKIIPGTKSAPYIFHLASG
jgi:flavin-dependent dehydrogenase